MQTTFNQLNGKFNPKAIMDIYPLQVRFLPMNKTFGLRYKTRLFKVVTLMKSGQGIAMLTFGSKPCQMMTLDDKLTFG